MRALPIDRWTVRAIGDVTSALHAVRSASYELGRCGYVHDALIEARVIAALDAQSDVEPGIDVNEEAQLWIGRTDWCFAAWVSIDRAMLMRDRIDLCFDWIDTVAEIRVNGCRVAVSANEFVPVRAPVRTWLREGHNEIEVRVRGPVSAVEALERRQGSRPVNGDWTPYCFLRKCASNFGWDWGPRAATVGIGPSRLEAWSGVRLHSVRPLVTTCDEREAIVEVHVDCEMSAARGACSAVDASSANVPRIVVTLGDQRATVEMDERGAAIARIRVANPDRWWPRGFGGQALHDLRVVLESESGGERVTQEIERRIGLRSVRLLTNRDEHGSRFALEVNGREIWCRGANWVPRAPLPRSAVEASAAALSRPQVSRDLEALAADANLNMLRVWGGGIYEDEAFYERCDELGILVWQDFMFACATYPEEAPYPELIEREARAQVTRLASHPSVVLWCGGNEDILAWWSWGWRERLRPDQTWGKRYWLELLPRVVRELDPTRPYWPESPYSGSMEMHPNDPDHGDRHTWDAKLEAYRTVVPRFCSEFGHQSPPTWEALCGLIPEHDRVIGSAALAARQRAWGGDAAQYATYLAERFPQLSALEDWVFAAQLLQARAYELAIVWMRANAPRCMGALFWQLNDVWIGHSWSVIDALGLKKPAYFAVKRACAAQALGIVPAIGDAPARVVLCRAAGEDGSEADSDHVALRLVDADGAALCEEALPLRAGSPWLASAAIPPAFLAPRAPAQAILVADVGASSPSGCALRATHAFVHDKDYSFGPERWTIATSARDSGRAGGRERVQERERAGSRERDGDGVGERQREAQRETQRESELARSPERAGSRDPAQSAARAGSHDPDRQQAGASELRIRAETLVRDICVAASLDPDDGMRTLLPGEEWTCRIHSAPTHEGRLVRSANTIGRADA